MITSRSALGASIQEGIAHAAGPIASPSLASIDGVEAFARAIRVPLSAHGEVERTAIARFASALLEAPESELLRMPSGSGVHELAELGAAAPSRLLLRDDRSIQACLDAWVARLGIDEHDPAANRARVDALMRLDADQLLDDGARREELRVLLALGVGDPFVPRVLGWTGPGQLADGLGWSYRLFEPRVRRLYENAQVLGLPERRAAFDLAVDHALETGARLPRFASIELLMSDAAGWSSRSTEERLRLLDALTGTADDRMTAYAHFADPSSVDRSNFDVLVAHLDRQLDDVVAGSARMPRGIEPYWLVKTPRWGERPASERALILDAFADRMGEPALVRIARDPLAQLIRSALRDDELAALREAIVPALRSVARAGEPLPSWVRFTDVLAVGDALGAARTHLYGGLLERHAAHTPDGVGSYLALAREQLDAGRSSANDAGVDSIRAGAIELIDRNLDRIAGRLGDTYANHPDHAEVGRIKAAVDLLGTVAGTANAGMPEPSAAASTGHLAWWRDDRRRSHTASRSGIACAGRGRGRRGGSAGAGVESRCTRDPCGLRYGGRAWPPRGARARARVSEPERSALACRRLRLAASCYRSSRVYAQAPSGT